VDNDGIPSEKSSKVYRGEHHQSWLSIIENFSIDALQARLESNGNAALIQYRHYPRLDLQDSLKALCSSLREERGQDSDSGPRTLQAAHLPDPLIHFVALAIGDCAFICDIYICFNIAIATTTPTNATRNFSFMYNT
jgi:hypothetical protein